MIRLSPERDFETGSFQWFARPVRTAPFPDGVLEWEFFYRPLALPVDRDLTAWLRAERFRPWLELVPL